MYDPVTIVSISNIILMKFYDILFCNVFLIILTSLESILKHVSDIQKDKRDLNYVFLVIKLKNFKEKLKRVNCFA